MVGNAHNFRLNHNAFPIMKAPTSKPGPKAKRPAKARSARRTTTPSKAGAPRRLASRRSWTDKVRDSKPPEVFRLDRAFSDLPEGCRMLIASPKIVDEYLRRVPRGTTRTVKSLREDLAASLDADHTCPLTTGIFLRIASEASWEQLQAGASPDEVAPFWRVVDPESALAKKLPCGPAFILQQRRRESRGER